MMHSLITAATATLDATTRRVGYGMAALLLAAAPAAAQMVPATTNDWRFALTPYIWGSGISGNVSLPGHSADLNADFGDVLDAMEFAYMAQFEAWKGRFGILMDGFVLMTESDFATPRGAAFRGGSADMTTAALSVVGLVRAYQDERVGIDLGAGLRAWSVDSKITLNPGALPGSSASSSTTFADPIIAFRAHVALTDRWVLNTYADIGGFNTQSDLTWQVTGTLGYHINQRFSFHAGYRYMTLERSRGDKALDIDMSGPLIGLTYRF